MTDIDRKSVIETMAAQLGEMAQRAADAERDAEAAHKDARQWYQFYEEKQRELDKANQQLADVQAAFDRLLSAKEPEGGQENG